MTNSHQPHTVNIYSVNYLSDLSEEPLHSMRQNTWHSDFDASKVTWWRSRFYEEHVSRLGTFMLGFLQFI